MKFLVIMIYTMSIFFVGCGYKTDPVYFEQNTTKGIK